MNKRLNKLENISKHQSAERSKGIDELTEALVTAIENSGMRESFKEWESLMSIEDLQLIADGKYDAKKAGEYFDAMPYSPHVANIYNKLIEALS